VCRPFSNRITRFFIAALRNAGKDCEIHVFTGANHSLQIVDGGDSAPLEEPLAGWLKRR